MAFKNPELRVEFRVCDADDTYGRYNFAADTEEECIQWIDDHTPLGLMGDVSFIIKRVFTTSRKRK